MTSEDVILYDVSLSTGTRVTRPSILIVSGSARVVVFGPWVNVDSEAELLTLCESLIDPLVVMPRKYSIRVSQNDRLFKWPEHAGTVTRKPTDVSTIGAYTSTLCTTSARGRLEPRALPTKIDNPWPRTHINVYESNAVGKLRNQHSPRQATDKMAVCES